MHSEIMLSNAGGGIRARDLQISYPPCPVNPLFRDYESGAHSRLGYPGYFLDYPGTFWYFYLRFLKNINPSFSHTYSKPVSRSALISSGLLATFTVNSSLYSPKIVFSTVM
jgi:hypothetical protein